MRDEFVAALEELALKDKKLMFITGDLGFGVFDNFEKKFPNQYLNIGVSEQNMIGVATGLALEGHKVFVYSIANFSTFRCLEQIRNDAAYHDANITVVSSGGGFTYGALGMSHHATEDIAIMRSIPTITVVAPTNPWETYHATKALFNNKGVGYLRIEKGGKNEPHYTGAKFKLNKPLEISSGEHGHIFVCGGIIEECKIAIKKKKKDGINIGLTSLHTIKPINIKYIKAKALEYKKLITVEEHNKSCGLGSAVSEVMTDCNLKSDLLRISIEDKFSSIVGDQEYLRKAYKIDSASITKRIKKFLDT